MIKTFENFLNESNNYGFTEIEPEKIHNVLDRLKSRDNILIACHWVVYPYIQKLLHSIYNDKLVVINCANDKELELFSENNKVFFLKDFHRTEPSIFPRLMNNIVDSKDSIFICAVNSSDKYYPLDDFVDHLTPAIKDSFYKIYQVVID